MRIAFAIMTHEADSFSPHATTLDDFRHRQLVYGPAFLGNLRGQATEEAGAMSILGREPGLEVVPLMAARTMSGGPVVADAFRKLLDDLVQCLQAALPVDGVFLVLHGAMMAEGCPDATGEILRAVRQVVGPAVPVVGTLDLHANLTARMVAEATALVGYHTAPHVDLYECGTTAASILVRTVKREIAPAMALVKLPLIVPAENARHTDGPLSEVLALALAAEKEGRVLHAAVYAVQPWLDAEDVGCSVVVVNDGDLPAARREAEVLATAFWVRRGAFIPALVLPDEAIRRALARESGTVVFCDSADAPTSGSTGDSTVVLDALLRAGPPEEMALLNVVDPAAVAQAIAAGVGQEVTVQVGGKAAPMFWQPVTFSGRVKLISDGVFRFKGPGMRGVSHSMGRTVVLVQRGIHLVVMELPVSQWDPQLYRSLGLEPTDARIVQVKSPAAFRAAYGPMADEIMIIESQGPASPNLVALPWKHLRRPIYPLDQDITWP